MVIAPNTTFAHGLTDSTGFALKTAYLHNVLEKAHCVMVKGKLDNREYPLSRALTSQADFCPVEMEVGVILAIAAPEHWMV